MASDHDNDPNQTQVVIVSGLSGSGKTTAVRALEDLGFFCIDNMPLPLLSKVLDLASTRESPQFERFAFVVDTRERQFLSEADAVITSLRAEDLSLQVLFFDADDNTLIRRYSETRRPHPVSDGGTVREGIQRERELLSDVRRHADHIVETTEHTPHTLKAFVKGLYGQQTAVTMQVNVLSFGFKHGLPPECDLVFDVRFLKNPYFVEHLRPMSGLDEPIKDYVLGQDDSGRFLRLFREIGDFMLPAYQRDQKSYLTIGIGCTGGRHRSVALTEEIGSRLRGKGWDITIIHRDLEK